MDATMITSRIFTKEEQKDIALKRMKELNIYPPYINRFKKDGVVTLFENFSGYYIESDESPEIAARIKAFEERTGCMVYAVTHEMFTFGEIYDFLVVSKYAEDERYGISGAKPLHYVFAWCENITDENCSEYGTIAVQSALGGIRRAG